MKEKSMRKIDEELIKAVQNDDVKAVGALVRKGADVNVQNEYGQTPLHMTIFKGARNLFETLLLLGADVNQKDCFGVPPLHRAIRLNRLKMMRRLLCEDKININQTDRYGFSAMHLASFAGFALDDLSLLVSAGANVNQRNGWGETPLFCVSTVNTAQNLLKLGADTGVKNRWGEVVFDYFDKKALQQKKDILKRLKYQQIAFNLKNFQTPVVSFVSGKKRLDYLRGLKGTSFLKYKRMVWQNDRG